MLSLIRQVEVIYIESSHVVRLVVSILPRILSSLIFAHSTLDIFGHAAWTLVEPPLRGDTLLFVPRLGRRGGCSAG
jgi:hypothetical protein